MLLRKKHTFSDHKSLSSSKEYEVHYCHAILPHLIPAVRDISRSQNENGSWQNSLFLSSVSILALNAYTEFREFSTVSIKESISRGRLYLLESIKKMESKILSIETVYKDLDVLSRDFGLASLCLSELGERDFVDAKWKKAFEILCNSLNRYLHGFGNMEALSLFLLSTVCFMDEIHEKLRDGIVRLLRFMIEECLSGTLEAADLYPACFAMIVLSRSHAKKFVHEAWKDVTSKRVDKWKKVEFREGIKELVFDYQNKIPENPSAASVAYLILASSAVDIEIGMNIIEKGLRLMEDFIADPDGKNLLELSMLSWALAESGYHKVIIMHEKEKRLLMESMRVYNYAKSHKLSMLRKEIVYFFVILNIVLVTVLYFASPLISQFFGALSAVGFLIGLMDRFRHRYKC